MKFRNILLSLVLILSLVLPTFGMAEKLNLESVDLTKLAEELYANYPQDIAGSIEFYQQKPEVEEWYDEAIELFTELYPNIAVEQNVQQDASNVLSIRTVSGEFTDVWLYWPTDAVFTAFQSNGLLMDVTDEPFVQYSASSPQSLYEFDGKMYGVPIAMNAAGLVCNMGMFKEAGLELPTTWTELLAVCDAFKAAGKEPFVLSCKGDADTTNRFLCGSYVTKEEIQAVANGEMKFSDLEGWKTAVDKLLTVFSYGSPAAASTDYNDGITEFALGKGAMLPTGNWAMNSIQNIDPELELKLIPFPARDDVNSACSGIDVGLSIGANTKYPEACKAFVNFLSCPTIAGIFCNHDAAIPAIKGIEVDDKRAEIIAATIAEGHSYNWPNHFFPVGGVDLAYAQAVSAMFLTRDGDAFMKIVDDLFAGVK